MTTRCSVRVRNRVPTHTTARAISANVEGLFSANVDDCFGSIRDIAFVEQSGSSSCSLAAMQAYDNNLRRASFSAIRKATPAIAANTPTCSANSGGTSPASNGRTSCVACDSGRNCAALCSAGGNCVSGKNTPESKVIGVMNRVK